MTEYVKKFLDLVRFAPNLVADESLRVRKFQRGLCKEIWDKIFVLKINDYQEVLRTNLDCRRDYKSSPTTDPASLTIYTK